MAMQLTVEMLQALLARLQAEYAETCVSNFALDILVASLKGVIAQQTTALTDKEAHVQALLERIAKQDKRIAEMQEVISPGRERFNAPIKAANEEAEEQTATETPAASPSDPATQDASSTSAS